MNEKYFEYGKIKIIILIIFILLSIFSYYSYLKFNGFCWSNDDCVRLKCGNVCANLCIQHKCTEVKCEDHGTLEGVGCVCDEGWTGRYCERKISE